MKCEVEFSTLGLVKAKFSKKNFSNIFFLKVWLAIFSTTTIWGILNLYFLVVFFISFQKIYSFLGLTLSEQEL